MKKIILLTICIAFSSVASSQFSEDIQYGFRTGLNYSTLSGDNLMDPESRLGFHASFFGEIPINERFSIVPELGVSALGVNEKPIRLSENQLIENKINWLQVTVLAKVNVSKKFHLIVGPQAGVNVTAKGDNDLYNYDILGVGGVGYMLTENLGIDARYGFGLSNIYDNAFEVNNEASNRYFQFGISYRL